MKIELPKGRYLKKVMTTQLKYPNISKNPFELRKISCFTRNIESISSSLHEDVNSLLSSHDKNLKVTNDSKESFIAEQKKELPKGYTSSQKSVSQTTIAQTPNKFEDDQTSAINSTKTTPFSKFNDSQKDKVLLLKTPSTAFCSGTTTAF